MTTDFNPEIIKTYIGREGGKWVSYFYPGNLRMLPKFAELPHVRVCQDGYQYRAGGFDLDWALKDGIVKEISEESAK